MSSWKGPLGFIIKSSEFMNGIGFCKFVKVFFNEENNSSVN